MKAAANVEPHSGPRVWHAVGADEAVSRLHTDPARGLNADEVARRLTEYGANRLPEGRRAGAVMRFLRQFQNILVYILLAAGFVKLLLDLWLVPHQSDSAR